MFAHSSVEKEVYVDENRPGGTSKALNKLEERDEEEDERTDTEEQNRTLGVDVEGMNSPSFYDYEAGSDRGSVAGSEHTRASSEIMDEVGVVSLTTSLMAMDDQMPGQEHDSQRLDGEEEREGMGGGEEMGSGEGDEYEYYEEVSAGDSIETDATAHDLVSSCHSFHLHSPLYDPTLKDDEYEDEDNDEWLPRLYFCQPCPTSNEGAFDLVRKYYFTQDDLLPGSVVVLDTKIKAYVW